MTAEDSTRTHRPPSTDRIHWEMVEIDEISEGDWIYVDYETPYGNRSDLEGSVVSESFTGDLTVNTFEENESGKTQKYIIESSGVVLSYTGNKRISSGFNDSEKTECFVRVIERVE